MKTPIFLMLFVALFAASCNNGTTTENKETAEQKTEDKAPETTNTTMVSELLAPADFMAKLKSSNAGQLIDVRTPEEVNAGAIEGSTNIDFNAAEFKEKMAKLDKSKPVFVYCRAGGRSAKAANVCKELGFKEIYDMQGGWDSYSAKK
jgi:phage shock protein E